ncbi:hypothetical protein ACFOY4_26655 [Actinomadura syzygii]|uniref:Uncharacterized protein n=1 Tax=Actinomadura syzygii TaxID=1427538 RepID=A0A5D0TMZ6_9ACTN|nr:hypothetical protein [Actinomadura syzygii]TYC07661.1 hypothetical protein FXF65_41175 [Actinomadura syzygii]
MAERKTAVPWQRGRLVFGGLLSIVLGSVTLLAGAGGTNGRLALIVTLASVNLTLVIDAFFRREESIHQDRKSLEEISAALAITKSLADAPPACHAFIREIAEQWTLIDRRNSAILLKLREARQRAFTEEMRDLANGQSPLGRRQEFRPGILPALIEMTALSATGNDYWWTGRDTTYLATERAAIARNDLALNRILVLSETEVDAAMVDVLREQLDAGIVLHVVIAETVPPLHQKCLTSDRALVTDKGGIVGVVIPGNDQEDAVADAGHFTINEDRIQNTRDILDALAPYQVPATEFIEKVAAKEIVDDDTPPAIQEARSSSRSR